MSEFDKWYTSHYDVETRMTDPGHRVDLLEAWMAGKRSVDAEIERLQAALLEQAGLWDLAKPILDVADARVCRVPFMELHEPDKKAREAARTEVGE